jgi:hypothetical protein
MLRAWLRKVYGRRSTATSKLRMRLVEARNRLAQAIAGAAMSGLTQDEIVELTGYTADRVLRICTDAGISEVGSEP